ncbi:hypothetical protein NMY22_g6624 [Coprinellus aureogranulatus]|nr:hypothetical protein NMY22_g6624 [Coprinellus aureogranulatus]
MSTRRGRAWLARVLPSLPDDPTHPAQVALRTYALALSFSLGPALIPVVISLASNKKKAWTRLSRTLRRELGYDGFASAMTLSVAGAAALKYAWTNAVDAELGAKPRVQQHSGILGLLDKLRRWLQSLNLTPVQVTFVTNFFTSSLGLTLLWRGLERSRFTRLTDTASTARPSPTLDLTLLLVVRALDSLVQSLIMRRIQPRRHTRVLSPSENEEEHLRMIREKLEREEAKQVNLKRQKMTQKVDAFLFWICSSRIMWCFFYEPFRLPRSYVKWINALASLDERIPEALRQIRFKSWSYIHGSRNHAELLHDCARDFGYPPTWGDPFALPAYGGEIANNTWKELGVTSRPGVGGLPCDLVHCGVGRRFGLEANCHANAALRGIKAFGQALLIYLPVHFIPILLLRPRSLLRLSRLLATTLSALRSTSFLASFVALYWYGVCITRTVVFAKLFQFVSHDFWDGPHGAILAGSLVCGASIWIENGRRRGEMALYVLPRALRTLLPGWLVRSRGWKSWFVERLAFILSMSTLLTAAVHRPDSLRGLSRWALAFVMNGPNAGFWKRKRQDPSIPPTPSVASTPQPAWHTMTPELNETLNHYSK